MTTTSIQRPDTRKVVGRGRRLTELPLPPMFFIHLDSRESPPKLLASDLPAPEKFHERLAAWLMKQH